ncbi:MAG: hypothetical protein K2N65_01085 [Anaeroplasmataceae bacterium]|nr:hypothetical protein [Anaeroplasmataceae bacterium]
MKLWRILLAILCLGIFTSCMQSTEYDNKDLVRIETITSEGFAFVPVHYVRTFDFEGFTITDEARTTDDALELLKKNYFGNEFLQKEYETYDSYVQYLEKRYNHPKRIKSVTEEEKEKFIAFIIQSGIYTWEEEYITDDIICDGAGFNILLYFSDGTVKKTYFYYKYPNNYNTIKNAFKYLDAGMFFESTE